MYAAMSWLFEKQKYVESGWVAKKNNRTKSNLLNVVLLQRLGSAVHRVLLHLLRHVGVFDNCFAIGHLDCAVIYFFTSL